MRTPATPKVPVEDCASLSGLPALSGAETRPFRIVSYATTPLEGVPAILARCITARAPDVCRCLWSHNTYDNGMLFEGDINWTTSPTAEAVLAGADMVIVHDGKVAPEHKELLADKAVVTLAHGSMRDVDQTFVKQGFPGVVVGQYQATLPEFKGWVVVPNPVPLWEKAFQPGMKDRVITICYTPSGKRDCYPPDHPLYWRSKGFTMTMQILEKLAAQFPLQLEVIRARHLPHAEVLAAKRRAHIVIDECVTGSYHASSLEGLAAGCVTINSLGLLPDILEAFRYCAGNEASNPFIFATLETLQGVLTSLIQQGPDSLVEAGRWNRRWMEQHWDFAWQWEQFWMPVISSAMNSTALSRKEQPSEQVALASRAEPLVSVVVVSHNEGEYLRRTVKSLLASLPTDSEVIVVDDGSTDGSADGLMHGDERVSVLRPAERLGVAGSRNYGASHAHSDIIVFSDAHVEVPPGWITPFLNVLARQEVGAVGPVISDMHHPQDKGYGLTWYRAAPLEWMWLGQQGAEPYPVPLLCGCFLAMRRDVFVATGGFDSGMIMYGMDDPELSMHLWTCGYECWLVPSVDIAHLSRDPASYPSYQLDWETELHNVLRLAVVHLGAERIRRVVEYRARDDVFPAAFARLATSDAWVRRSEIHRARRHDDDWFFRKFNMD